jgi:VanZ family protein
MTPAATHSTLTPATRHAPALAACYAGLLVYGTLAPWEGWRSLGVGPFAYLTAPLPQHLTFFDLMLNVLAYLPLGALLALAWAQHWPRLRAGCVAALAAMLLSLLLEAAQTWLPLRIPSNVDLATNAAGGALGALLGALLAPTIRGSGRLNAWTERWFIEGPSLALVVLLLWPLAQLPPSATLFGTGAIERDWIAALLAHAPLPAPRFSASEFAAAEALIVTAGMLSAGLALNVHLRQQAPRLLLVGGMLGFVLLVKTLAYGARFGQDDALLWLTPGAIAGLLIGSLALTAAVFAPPAASARLAATALAGLVVAVNLVPENPYYLQWVGAWRPGRMRDVLAAAEVIATLWPFALLAALWFDRRRASLREGRSVQSAAR